MRSFASIKLGPLGSFNVQHSITTDSDRPAGVAADAWIRLEENLGVVITAPKGGAPAATQPSSASGYMMVKYNGAWLRLNLETSST
jgi:hypothetical protein